MRRDSMKRSRMFNATEKIARVCQASLTSSLRRIIVYLDAGQTGRHTAPLVSPNYDDERFGRSTGERPLAANSSHPHLSLAFEDATREATLSIEKLSPIVIRDLHNAMDDLTIDPLTDSSD
jgi:hypothetical protein